MWRFLAPPARINDMQVIRGIQVIASSVTMERKVRTPKDRVPGEYPGTVQRKLHRTESVTETIPPRFIGVRVKRRGKSPPAGS